MLVGEAVGINAGGSVIPIGELGPVTRTAIGGPYNDGARTTAGDKVESVGGLIEGDTGNRDAALVGTAVITDNFVGLVVGVPDGRGVAAAVGEKVGKVVGGALGGLGGESVGNADGLLEGLFDGEAVGLAVGLPVGDRVGFGVGPEVGEAVS